MEVRKITYLETFPVRSSVLRKGKPIETCFFLGDDNHETIHFGLFKDTTLIGVASVFKVKNDNFEESNQLQLRGMAVLEKFKVLGYGNLILEEICTIVVVQKQQ